MAKLKVHGEREDGEREDGPTEGRLVKVKEGAAYLSMSRTWIYGEMDAGRLPYVKLGRSRRIRLSDIKRLARDGVVGDSD